MRAVNQAEPFPNAEHADGDEALGVSLAQSLDQPLSALRASIESLSLTLSGEAPGRNLVDGILRGIERIERNVRDLADYARQPVPTPSRCGAGEIAVSARAALPEKLRSSVTVACAPAGALLHIDRALLARCLQRLMELALDGGCEQVLLIVRREEARTCFSVIDDGPSHARRTEQGSSAGLGLALVERDVALLGGTLMFRRSTHGETCAALIVPDGVDPGGVG